MLDYKPTLVNELKAIGLPVHYELFISDDKKLPCISYQEGNNVVHKDGATLGYSYITYRIKVWSKRVSELSYYSVVIDNLMRELGFERIGTSEMWFDGVGQNQLTYRGLGLEEY